MKIVATPHHRERTSGGDGGRERDARRFAEALRAAATTDRGECRGGQAVAAEWSLALSNGPLAGAALRARVGADGVHLHIVGRDAAQRAHVARCRERLCASMGELLSCAVVLEFDDETD
ncbi:hypothetical protein [Paludibacterium yongneupense]|uniref:hypothetical protein n=1 Tax=Paludibacterium yongneupense TaxID=400061 RepID=UPI0003F6E2F2|nr:hypothetical protein [Paludibacterium yongneupense]